MIDFSIGGKLKDQVWCDVIPFDVCYILLAQPWQYDMKADMMGSGIFSRLKDGERIVLQSCRGEDSIDDVVPCATFLRVFSEFCMRLTLVILEGH